MKTTTPAALCAAYDATNPAEAASIAEHCARNNTTISKADREQPFEHWLAHYAINPSRAIATTNWCGKVTTALFHALGIKQPRTKAAMLAALK